MTKKQQTEIEKARHHHFATFAMKFSKAKTLAGIAKHMAKFDRNKYIEFCHDIANEENIRFDRKILAKKHARKICRKLDISLKNVPFLTGENSLDKKILVEFPNHLFWIGYLNFKTAFPNCKTNTYCNPGAPRPISHTGKYFADIFTAHSRQYGAYSPERFVTYQIVPTKFPNAYYLILHDFVGKMRKIPFRIVAERKGIFPKKYSGYLSAQSEFPGIPLFKPRHVKKWFGMQGIRVEKSDIDDNGYILYSDRNEDYHCGNIHFFRNSLQQILRNARKTWATRRKIETDNSTKSLALQHVKEIFISKNDSVRAGNCLAGINSFCQKVIAKFGNDDFAIRADLALYFANDFEKTRVENTIVYAFQERYAKKYVDNHNNM